MLPTESPVTRRRTLLIALGAGIIVFILWNLPIGNTILYPFRLFVSYIHEIGHGSMALLTGGKFLGFEIFANGAGQALTAGGSRLLILPAGYLGAAAFGAILFYLTNSQPYTRTLSAILGVLLLIFSVIFGLSSLLAFAIGVAFAIMLFILAAKANREVNILILNILAILTGLNAVLDLWYLVRNSSASLGTISNDAAAFSRDVFPLIPAALWAFLWAVLAVIFLSIAIWYSVVRPIRKHLSR